MILNQEIIKNILKELFRKRNYISEGDLRVNFVVALDRLYQPKYIIANFPVKCADRTVYEDLRIVDEEGNAFLIEFKYCPSKVPIPFGGFEVETRKRTPKKKRVARFNEECERIRQMMCSETSNNIRAAFCIFITNQKNLTKNTPFPFEDLSADFKICVQEIQKEECLAAKAEADSAAEKRAAESGEDAVETPVSRVVDKAEQKTEEVADVGE